jgi:Zn-finger nucleic acid-binding protein
MSELTCPKCQSPMRAYERNGVTIDQCTGCRGLFLDRGELERLVDAEGSYYEREAMQARAPEPERPRERERERERYDYDSDREPTLRDYFGKPGHGHGSGYHKKRKRKSFLEDLFD